MALSVVAHVAFAWALGQVETPTAVSRPELEPMIASGATAARTGVLESLPTDRMGVDAERPTGPNRDLAGNNPPELAAALRGDLPENDRSDVRRESHRTETETPDRSGAAPPTPEGSSTEPEPESSPTDRSSPNAERHSGPATPSTRSAASATFPSIEGDGRGSGDGNGDSRGGISLALIEQVIRAHHDEILKCFASRHDYLSVGRKVVAMEFWLGTDGYPDRVRTRRHTTNDAVADCVMDRIAEWKFPELDRPVRFGKTFVFNSEIKAKWVRPRMRVPPN